MQITGATIVGCVLGNTETYSDPYYANVSLLLPMTGPDNSTTFTDYSSSPKTVTPSGGLKITTSLFKYGGSSGFFLGNGSLSVPGSSAFDFGTGDFTIETWSYLDGSSSTYKVIVSIGYPGAAGADLSIRYGDNGFGRKLQVSVNSGTVAQVWSCDQDQNTDLSKWQHVAFTRQSGVCRLFVNGTQKSLNNTTNPSTFPYTQFTDSTNVTGVTSVKIGGDYGYYVGYMDDLRITAGIARYTSNFVPPAASFPTQ